MFLFDDFQLMKGSSPIFSKVNNSIMIEIINVQSIGEDIGYELGARFVKNNFDATGEYVGHIFGKKILGEILKQEGVEGIRFYQARNELGFDALVAVGVKKDMKDLRTIVADRAYMCPPYCSEDDLDNPGW